MRDGAPRYVQGFEGVGSLDDYFAPRLQRPSYVSQWKLLSTGQLRRRLFGGSLGWAVAEAGLAQ